MNNGDAIASNFNTKEECEEYVLGQTDNIKKSIIVNKKTKERIIVDWSKE